MLPPINTSDVQGRRGLTFEKWPFRLDIQVQYQDWLLVGVTCFVLSAWFLPCCCGSMRNGCGRAFTHFIYTRLDRFFFTMFHLSLGTLAFTVLVLPDWTFNEYLVHLFLALCWVLEHIESLIQSGALMFIMFVLFKFRERIAKASGMDYVTFFRFGWRDIVGLPSKRRPIEIFIWKVEGIDSSVGSLVRPNDLFIEAHMGYNEPMRTRVHNQAGSGCIIGESFQMNVDESSSTDLMTLFVKDQHLISSTEIARVNLGVGEILAIEEKTGKQTTDLTYDEHCFLAVDLQPRGRMWIAIAPVDDGNDERSWLMSHA